MRHVSTPATRAYARDKAETIGQAERIVYGELRDMTVRVLTSKLAPVGAVVAGLGVLHLVFTVASKLP